MEKLKDIKSFINESERLKKSLTSDSGKIPLKVCTGGGCIASGSLKILNTLNDELRKAGISDKVSVKATGCLGPCSMGPVIIVGKDEIFYQGVIEDDISDIVNLHLIKGKVVSRLTYRDDEDRNYIEKSSDIKLFNRQEKVVLSKCGQIDPNSIEDYISFGGYSSLTKIFSGFKSEDVIKEVEKSGLRGRGGGGFPTFIKWNLARKAESALKYILCNADEGDPGAYMDRSILEGDPHSVIEGMITGAYAIGASQGYVYVRAEYPLAIERLQNAIKQAYHAGLLGVNILDSGFSFDLEIRMGSGAFVCGEETALIHSIEGKRGEPRPRPPFPSDYGLWGKPTVLNNVETFANISNIINKGGDWFANFGTEKSKGTKIFALAGEIKNSGLFEVPVGTKLGDLIYDIGGGTNSGKPFKAAQIGGPSGGCIPKNHLNVPLDYEALNELGAIMGSGGLVVMDENTCMVDVAKFFIEFVQEESCGKCTPCRTGTKRMLEILEKITSGNGVEGDIEALQEISYKIKSTALCGLGQTAPNPVLSTIRYFRDEYEAHIKEKKCPAGICPDLVSAPCQSGCPADVDIPGFVSLVGEKRYAEALKLHRERNPFASVCARVCFHTCESKCRRTSLDDSVSIRGIKRFMVEQEITVQIPEVRENPENALRKIAIIGAGPAGLSCAYFLARLGYKPKIFESEYRPGGMLVQTIPAYRLPREVLAREIRMIENLGVDIETNKKLGRDFTLDELREMGYEAVFMGVGTPKGTKPPIPGVDSEGVVDALDFLKTYNLRGSVPVGSKVAIIGGGNAAIDAARTALRLGSEKVSIIYRRTRDEMPAWEEEINAALDEEIDLKVLTNPSEILSKNGKVKGIKCQEMKLGEFDNSGRRKPVKSESFFEIEANQVIIATGQEFEDEKILGEYSEELIEDGRIKFNSINGQTIIPWLFTGGDIATGPMSVVEAVGGGEKAAVGIDKHLSGEEHAFWRERRKIDTYFDPDEEPVPYPRKNMDLLSPERRKVSFEEVEQVFRVEEAVRQAKRCLRCDYGKV